MGKRSLLENFKAGPNFSSVYQVGCFASPLNVHAQQKRAFNLVYALKAQELVHEGTDIAVVGAGISGITASLALHVLGANVTIYESASEVIHLQRRNATRFLHPNFPIWPRAGFGYPITHLPFMNWRAEGAGHVANQLIEQWKYFEKQLAPSVHLHSKVKKVVENLGTDPYLIFEDGRPNQSHQIIVIATGFGIERPKFSTTSSYWRNDDLEQILFPEQGRKILVTGSGDGGLIDVLRLSFLDFNHKKFLQDLMYDDWLRELSREMTEKLKKTPPVQAWQEFMAIDDAPKPAFLAANKLRTDTSVIINSRRSCPFETESHSFHRLLVGLLLKYKLLEHVVGDLTDVYSDKFGKYVASIKRVGSTTEKLVLVDRIIERHRASSSYAALLGNVTDSPTVKDDLGHRFLRRVEFLSDEFMPAHYEKGYEVGVVLKNGETANQCADTLLGKLENVDYSNFQGQSEKVTCYLNEIEFFLSRRKREFLFPKETVDCLVLETTHRQVLERVLWSESRSYNFLKTFVTWKNPPHAIEDRYLETEVMLTYDSKEKSIEVQSKPGLYEAYRLFRVPTLLQIMGNKWPLKKVHGYGWAVRYTRRTNRDNIEATKLLEFEDF